MDWIERVTGLAPDGGSGITELMFLLGGITIVAIVLGFGLRKRWR
jgi:hypothetical protein